MAFQASELAVEAVRAIRPVLDRLSERDTALRNQLLSAAQSVVLNLDEGSWKTGRDRLNRFRIAAGSAAEVRGALRVSEALGYVSLEDVSPALALLDHVLAILWKILGPRK